MNSRNKTRRIVTDWASINGAPVVIVRNEVTIACGLVDDVTADGSIVWVQDDTGQRKLYERAELYEIWVRCEDIGLNYKVSSTFSACT